MNLPADECAARLRASIRGVLATVHPRRGVDAVPVVYAVAGDGRIVVPVDTVKPKSDRRLQRVANIERDDRCVLLVDGYDDDWSQLWWVRVHARATAIEPTDALVALLAARYVPYALPGAVTTVIVLTPYETTGWAASSRGQ